MSADLVAFDSLGDWEDYRIFAVPREAEVDIRYVFVYVRLSS
jgi:hypothetical protein